MDENVILEKVLSVIDFMVKDIDEENMEQYFKDKSLLYNYFYENGQIRRIFLEVIPPEKLSNIDDYIHRLCMSPSFSKDDSVAIKQSLLNIKMDINYNCKKSRGVGYMKRIFISHSSLDKDYVEKIINLLEDMGVKSDRIFCTSFEGYGIALGEDFLEKIKKELNEEVLVLFILSSNFYKSVVSMCEMGATWIKTNKHIPIVIPPFTYSDIKGVISTTQGLIINQPSKINTLYEEIKNDMAINDNLSMSIWERKRNRFLDDVNNIINSQADQQKIENEQQTNETITNNLKSELLKKDSRIQNLKVPIDKDVEKVEDDLQYNKSEEEFERIIDEVKSNMNYFSDIVRESIYYSIIEKPFFIDSYSYPDKVKEAILAEEEDYITKDGNYIELNIDDPKVRRAIKSVNILADFLTNVSSEFHDAFENKYDIRARIESKKFWNNFKIL